MAARLAEVAMRSPSLCGRCKFCKSAGGFLDRFRNYVINLGDGEIETTKGAIDWLSRAYPKCPDGSPGVSAYPDGRY